MAAFDATATNVTLGWNDSPDPTVTGYRLYYGGASGTYTNLLDAGLSTSVTVPTLAPGETYYFAATCYTDTGLESDYSVEVAYLVPAQNQPPTLDPLGDVVIPHNAGPQTVVLSGISSGSVDETQTLVVTCFSSNPSLIPHPSLSYTSPNSSGSLVFSPAPNSYGSTVLTVMVDDGGSVSNTAIRSFTVVVTGPESVIASGGNTNIQAGQTFRYPIYVSANEPLTNLTFRLGWPTNRFRSPTLSVSAPFVSGALQQEANSLLVTLGTAPGQPLQGSNMMAARVRFQTIASQPGGLVPMPVAITSATKASGVAFTNLVGQPGLVGVVNDTPVLVAGSEGASRRLTILARAGTSGQLQFATNGAPGCTWWPLADYQQSNLVQTLSVDPSPSFIIYRLRQD